ncbi:hypothetical protein [Devosia sp. A369]
MSSALVDVLVRALVHGGYTIRKTPFKVASVEFDFTAAMVGSGGRSLDLVLVVDTATGSYGDLDPSRVRQRIEALSRALDITGSRYVITTILAGASLTGVIEALSNTCRVLTVQNIALNDEGLPANDAAARELEDQIRILLPLKVNFEDEADDILEIDPMSDLLTTLPDGLDLGVMTELAEASRLGEDEVKRVLSKTVERALAAEGTP